MLKRQAADPVPGQRTLACTAGHWRTGLTGPVTAWLGSGAVAAVATGWAMHLVVTNAGGHLIGRDFWNNTWRAVRGLLAGDNIYGPAHVSIPGIGHGWPVSPHIPGSLLWQAPFALLPFRAAVFAYAFVSILAIWAAVFLLTRPRASAAVFLTACCGAFAIYAGGRPATLILGQPTAFTLLGLAMVVRVRRPWLAGLGYLLIASTPQTALPLGAALVLLGGWPIVWRGAVLVLATSLPPFGLEIANAGFHTAVSSVVSSAWFQGRLLAMRIDLGALLQRLGVPGMAVRAGAGLLVAALALAFLARLPPHLRRTGYPPALCLVIAFTLVSTYHEAYDMLLVGGGLVPVILMNDRSRDMLPAFALAGIGAGLYGYYYFGYVIATIALLGIGLFSARAAWRDKRADAATATCRDSGPGSDSGDCAPIQPAASAAGPASDLEAGLESRHSCR